VNGKTHFVMKPNKKLAPELHGRLCADIVVDGKRITITPNQRVQTLFSCTTWSIAIVPGLVVPTLKPYRQTFTSIYRFVDVKNQEN